MRNESGMNEDVHSMSTRQYLDSTVVPILMQALNEVSKQRPQQPVDFIVQFLKDNNPEGPSGGATNGHTKTGNVTGLMSHKNSQPMHQPNTHAPSQYQAGITPAEDVNFARSQDMDGGQAIGNDLEAAESDFQRNLE